MDRVEQNAERGERAEPCQQPAAERQVVVARPQQGYEKAGTPDEPNAAEKQHRAQMIRTKPPECCSAISRPRWIPACSCHWPASSASR